MNYDKQASLNTIRALIGDRAGFRETSILDAQNATVYRPRNLPGCLGVRSFNVDGSARTFAVRLSDGEIVN